MDGDGRAGAVVEAEADGREESGGRCSGCRDECSDGPGVGARGFPFADEEEAELAILETYLPKLLSREEIAKEARQVIAETGATGMGQMGPVMGQLMSKLKGRADGRVVNAVVRELLSG